LPQAETSALFLPNRTSPPSSQKFLPVIVITFPGFPFILLSFVITGFLLPQGIVVVVDDVVVEVDVVDEDVVVDVRMYYIPFTLTSNSSILSCNFKT